MTWRTWIGMGVGTLGAGILLLAYGPGSLDAWRFDPAPPSPVLDSLFVNPADATITEPGLRGAEDLEPGPDGRLYASLADGRIMARSPNGSWEEFARSGGRPLGMAFSPDGTLFVADALEGLLRLESDSDWTVLAEAGDPPALRFPDDVTVGADGTIYLTDASERYGYGDVGRSFWEGEQTGRLLAFPPDGSRRVVAEGLAFANGVAVDRRSGFVYVAETWAAAVHVYDPASGDWRVLIDGLPGYPDNVHWDGEAGLLWIAMPARRIPLAESLHRRPFLKRLAWRAAGIVRDAELEPSPVMALAVDASGKPVRALYGVSNQPAGITIAVPWEEQVWVAGVDRQGIEAFEPR
ncbi:MAG: SMP-30/gluconolactonase/LRE family protein [Gemmatimonadota bacterium]